MAPIYLIGSKLHTTELFKRGRTLAGEFESIPFIDVNASYRDDAGARQTLAASLHATLRDVGFAYVTGHRVAGDLIADLRRQSELFFARPSAEKARLAINDWHRGYMAPNSSTIVTSSVAKVKKPNQSESFMALHELAEDDPDLLAGKPLQGPNQWPEGQPAFRAAALAYMAAMEDLARRLTAIIALGLGLPETTFDPYFARPTIWLRLLHYPPQPAEDGLFGSAPHTDYGFLTLLAQDEVGGLEVRNAEGRWIPAPPVPDSFVLNVGDILARWSGGRLTSTPHRVINRSGRERYSQPYFFDPSLDAIIAPLADATGTAIDPVRFGDPVCFGDYVMERLDKNYDYRRSPTS